MARPIGTLGTIETLTVGGYVFADTANMIQLYGYINTGVNDRHSSYRAGFGAGSGYAVTTGKTLKWKATEFTTNSANNIYQLGYGDDSVTSGAAPTNAVFDLGTGSGGFYSFFTSTAYVAFTYPTKLDVPATKIPFFRSQNTGTLSSKLFGYEV